MKKIEITLTGEIQDDACIGFDTHRITVKSNDDTYCDLHNLKIVALKETEE